MLSTALNLLVLAFILVLGYFGVNADFMYKSYQHSVVCYSQHPPRSPRGLSEIQDILRYAIAYNVTVKVLGNRHSISDSICTFGIPVNMTYIRHFSYDPKTQVATVGAGMEVGDFLEKLHQYGRGLWGAPDYGSVTVGGAIATGSHGTTLKHPATLSEQIISVTLVDGRGNVRKITKEDELFKAVRVSLGLLGIVYQVEFATEPQYKLHIKHFPIPDGIIRNGSDLVKIAKEHDIFQFWWFPTGKQIILATGDRLRVHEPGNCETRMVPEINWFTENAISTGVEIFQATRDDITMFNVQSYVMLALYKHMPGSDPIFVEDDGETACLEETIGYGHRLTNNKCQDCAWQWEDNLVTNEDTEIFIPLHKLMPALRTMMEIFEKQLAQFPGRGVRVRFVKRGDAYMGMNEGEMDWAAIEWITVPRWDRSLPKMGIAAFQVMGQVLVEQYGGRPHWSKGGFYYSNSRIIRKAHPNLDKFIAAMNEFDPLEIFMNTFGERIKYKKERYTLTSEMVEHCALNEVCVCKNNYDCGNEGLLDYRCAEFPGFPSYNVCMPGMLEGMKEAYSRSVIRMVADFEYGEESVITYLKQFTLFNDILLSKKKNGKNVKGTASISGDGGSVPKKYDLTFLKAFN